MEPIEEESLVDAARVITRALDSNKEISDETLKVLADLGARLMSMGKIIEIEDEGEEEEEEGGLGDVKGRVSSIQEKIAGWEDYIKKQQQ
nr:exocyst complex component EXO70B1-like [Tanacetum cinerariifolium]